MGIEATTKTSGDVIEHVKRQFGDESGVQLTDQDILRWINSGQREITMRNPEVNAAMAMANSVSGQADYVLRDEISDIITIQSVHFKNMPVEFMSFQSAQIFLMDQTEPPSPAERPNFWYEHSGVLTFHPAPVNTEPNAIKVYYNKTPKEITSNNELLSVPDNYYNAVVSYCMKQAYAMDENFQASGVMSQEFDVGVQLMQLRTLDQANTYPTITIFPED